MSWLCPHTRHRVNIFSNLWASICSALWDSNWGVVLQSLLDWVEVCRRKNDIMKKISFLRKSFYNGFTQQFFSSITCSLDPFYQHLYTACYIVDISLYRYIDIFSIISTEGSLECWSWSQRPSHPLVSQWFLVFSYAFSLWTIQFLF